MFVVFAGAQDESGPIAATQHFHCGCTIFDIVLMEVSKELIFNPVALLYFL